MSINANITGMKFMLILCAAFAVAMCPVAAHAEVDEAVETVASEPIITADEIGEAADFESASPATKAANPAGIESFESIEAQGDAEAPTLQTLNFNRDSSIRDALRFLAARYQKNIVPSQRVDGPLTVTSLRDVTFDEAMQAILGHGFVYEEKGNFINVYAAEEYKRMMEDPARLQTKVFRLYYISAAEAMRLIRPVMSGAGTIQGSSPAEQVVPTGESISAGSSGGDSMALNDMLVVKDYPEKLVEIEDMLRELDQRPLQVLIEAAIVSVRLDESTRFGIDWSSLGGIPINSVAGVAASGGGLATSGFAPLPDSRISIGITRDKVSALITALDEITDATVLANPRILAINKQLGQVYIGRKVGYEDQTTIAADGTTTVGSISFLETGTKLAFRPYIGNDGYIRMDIQPKDSTGDLNEAGIPFEVSTELATNILLKNGETVVIGGLFRNSMTTNRSQVPLLGNLPVVGAAFRGTRDSIVREEVVVMLTPHIIRSPGDIPSEQAIEDVELKMEGARKQMQWFGRAKLAETYLDNAMAAWKAEDYVAALEEVEKALHIRPTYTEALRLRKNILKVLKEYEAAMMREMAGEDAA